MSTATSLSPTTETPMPRAALAESAVASVPAPAELGYFQQNLPVNLILFSFAFVTIPFALVQLVFDNPLVFWTYIWLFGMTHFVVTFVVYFQSRNLRYFLSSPKNIAIYFAIPIAIFVGFDLLHAFKIGATFPVFALCFWGVVRLFNFNHFNRQTFGVYQLFKVRAGMATAKRLKACENGYFNSLSALLFVTFLSGGVSPLFLSGGWFPPLYEMSTLDESRLPVGVLQGLACAALASTLGFLVASLKGFRDATARAGNPQAIMPALLYLLFQSIGAVAAAIYLPLYAAALALHYVEYHVLMVPRTLNIPLDETSRLDRTYGQLRSNRFVFYTIILLVSLVVTLMSYTGMSLMGWTPESMQKPVDQLLLLSAFDGLFVFHYFIEMFIWRFSDPYYRQSLAGLYFAPKK